MLIIAQCEILAKCNHREMLRKINEHKEISAVPQKKFSGNNSKLEVDIIPHALQSLLVENKQNPASIKIP